MIHQWCSALQQRCPPVPAQQQLLLLAASRPGTRGSAVLIPAAWQPQEQVQERYVCMLWLARRACSRVCLAIRSGLCSAVAGDGGSMLHDSAYRVDAVAKANHHSFVLKEVLVWCNLEPWTQELGRTVDCLLKITTPKP